MIERIVQGYRLTRASQLAERGRVQDALRVIEKTKTPKYNRAIVEAFKAYLKILCDDDIQAKQSIINSRTSARKDTESGRYVRMYCDYLEAMMENRTSDWNVLISELNRSGGRTLAKSILIVDTPMGPQDYGDGLR